MLSGIGIDDHAALHYVNNQLERIVRANDIAAAYEVFKEGSGISEKKMEAAFIRELLNKK